MSIQEEFQQYLVSFHNYLNECILGRGENVLELLDTLDGRSPILIDILGNLYELHNLFDFSIIENVLEENNSKYIELSLISNEIKSMYRKLYYLKNYQNLSVKSLNEFFSLYERSKEKTRTSIKSHEKKHVNGNSYNIPIHAKFLSFTLLR